MSDQPADVAATESDAEQPEKHEQQETKPTETVEFWKTKSRDWEKLAKSNKDAAKRLTELEDAQKSDAEKATDRIAAAEAEVASLPAKVAASLRDHLVALHQIDAEDAELFLTAGDPDLLLKQVTRLLGQADKKTKQNHVPREGKTPTSPGSDDARETVRELFGP